MKDNRDKEELLREGRKDEPMHLPLDNKETSMQEDNLEEKAEAEQEYKEALTERD